MAVAKRAVSEGCSTPKVTVPAEIWRMEALASQALLLPVLKADMEINTKGLAAVRSHISEGNLQKPAPNSCP